VSGHFPILNAMVELAKDETGAVIGVTIHSLILTENVSELPEMFRKMAQDMLYKHAVETDGR
jgi:hypothetical protein